MVVRNFNVRAIAVTPDKTNTPLIVDTNAVLFPGGVSKSAKVAALFSIRNFRRAACCTSSGKARIAEPLQTNAVALSRKLSIMPTITPCVIAVNLTPQSEGAEEPTRINVEIFRKLSPRLRAVMEYIYNRPVREAEAEAATMAARENKAA